MLGHICARHQRWCCLNINQSLSYSERIDAKKCYAGKEPFKELELTLEKASVIAVVHSLWSIFIFVLSKYTRDMYTITFGIRLHKMSSAAVHLTRESGHANVYNSNRSTSIIFLKIHFQLNRIHKHSKTTCISQEISVRRKSKYRCCQEERCEHVSRWCTTGLSFLHSRATWFLFPIRISVPGTPY